MRAGSLSLEAGLLRKRSVSEIQPNTQTKTRHDALDLLSDQHAWLNRDTTRPQTAETRTNAPNILGS